MKKKLVKKALKIKAKKKVRAKHIKPKANRAKISPEQIEAIVHKGQERGFITTSEILYIVPNVEYNIQELEGLYDVLRERGIELKEVKEFLEVGGKKEKKQKKAILGKI